MAFGVGRKMVQHKIFGSLMERDEPQRLKLFAVRLGCLLVTQDFIAAGTFISIVVFVNDVSFA